MSHFSALSSKRSAYWKKSPLNGMRYSSPLYLTRLCNRDLGLREARGFLSLRWACVCMYVCQTMNARSGDTCVWPGPLWRLLCRQCVWEDSAAACSDTDDPATWTPLSWSSSNTPAPSERWLDRPLHHHPLDNTNAHTHTNKHSQNTDQMSASHGQNMYYSKSM